MPRVNSFVIKICETMKKYFVILFQTLAGLILILGTCHGQQIVSPNGGLLVGSNYDLSWTIGESITSSLEGNNYALLQGFNQPSIVITNVFTHKSLTYTFKAYPNPVEHSLTIENTDFNQACEAVLFNSSGSVVIHQKFPSGLYKHFLELESVPQGVYFLNIISLQGLKLQSFKIVKI